VRHKLLDTVVLTRNIPFHGLLTGDLGTIVEMYGSDAFEVKFVTASGRTGALVILQAEDIRSIEDTDLIAVRRLGRTA